MAIWRFYFLFALVLPGHGLGLNCTESRCGGYGPDIRFPFRIKDRQPSNCGHPGFDLTCTERNQTLLELPTAVRLQVQRIDYKSQVIYASDPQGCLLRQLLNLNLSASHFQIDSMYKKIFSLFNCSSNILSFPLIPCLSTIYHKFYAVNSLDFISDTDLLYCTKMYEIISVPSKIVSQGDDALRFSWSIPRCVSCEAEGRLCRLKDNSTDLETECYGTIQRTKGAWRKLLRITGETLGFFLFVLVIIALYWIYNSDRKEREYQAKIERFLDDYRALKPARYSYADLKRITNKFRDELGQGAYGTVFKGQLVNEIPVAVKILNNSKRNGEEFVNEVGTMGRIHHVNVVRLIGFCADGFRRALVCEYLPNDSLHKFISSADAKSSFLGWERLNHIAVGIAKGIEYLHQGCDQRILHFDIKPSNILLDNDFNPKITDFGLAKLCSKDKSAISMTTARGTIGYIAPEVFSRNFGNVSYKSDVYSFGMLLLEMVGGRKNFDDAEGNDDQIFFPEWIYNMIGGAEDQWFHIEEEGDAKLSKKLAIVALWCIQWNPANRPSMKIVVQMLEGEGENLTKPPNPFSTTAPKRVIAGIPGRHLHPELATISENE